MPCPDNMLLPPWDEGRRLQCQLEEGHSGFHAAHDPDTPTLIRRWPRPSTDPHLTAARNAAGANVTPLKGHTP